LRGFALMFCFLPINTLALGTLPQEEVKNASGLYNLMRNLGGAIGLAVANSLMIQLTKGNYAVLREHVAATSPKTRALLDGLSQRLSVTSAPDSELAALKQLYGLTMREAEVLTQNTMFHILALVFFIAIMLMPWVNNVSAESGESGGH
jgi:DHA2 family multidrug resistance protein